MRYVLQYRWKLHNKRLVYYGLRNGPKLFQHTITISKRQQQILALLPANLTPKQCHQIQALLGQSVVLEDQLIQGPSSLEQAQFCRQCVANDFILPGLCFDDNGLCPMCQTSHLHHQIQSLVPTVATIAKQPQRRYDVALFYTGGKDSSYLLYRLSKVMKLRVLALTWEIPFLSDNAKQSIQQAKEVFPEVTFMQQALSTLDSLTFYQHLYELSGNVCACPSLAYVLFYPLLVQEKIPYFIAGNEPVQMMSFYYNQLAPFVAYRLPQSKPLMLMFQLGRWLQGKPSYQVGQFQTMATMKQLAYGDPWYKKYTKYNSPLIANIVSALKTIPHVVQPFQQAIKTSLKTNHIPRFVQLPLDEYQTSWDKMQALLIQECNWTPPKQSQQLHTSCRLESCKTNTQFRRFLQMESTMMPMAALEISLANSLGLLSKEAALKEIRQGGFRLEKDEGCLLMEQYLRGEDV